MMNAKMMNANAHTVAIPGWYTATRMATVCNEKIVAAAEVPMTSSPAAPPAAAGCYAAMRIDLRRIVELRFPSAPASQFPINAKYVGGDASRWRFVDQALYDLRGAATPYTYGDVVYMTSTPLMYAVRETDFCPSLAFVHLVSPSNQPGMPCHAVIYVRDCVKTPVLALQVAENIVDVVDAYIAETVAHRQTRHAKQFATVPDDITRAWNDADGPYGKNTYKTRTLVLVQRDAFSLDGSPIHHFVNNPWKITHKYGEDPERPRRR